jgi:hypothetical protein
MALPNIFSQDVTNQIILRINALTPSTTPQWGTMSAAQMLSHCNVTYEMVYDDIHPKPSGFMKFILKLLVKGKVVGQKPYSKNSSTAPQFLIKGDREFEVEKERLVSYLKMTEAAGAAKFEGKESHSFGALTSTEWNNMLYKHLDHHLTQFGV